MGFLAGSFVDRYRLVELLGEGGQGQVWRAEDRLAPGTERALKLTSTFGVKPQHLERLRREARRLVQLSHPGVVRCVHLFEDLERGVLGLALELVRGEPLDKALERGLPEVRVRGVLAELAEILAYLHAAGVVHRDLKPENLLLVGAPGAERLMLIDFGIAVGGDDAHPVTQLGVAIGTPAFMPPESLAPAAWPGDPRAPTVDVFAFGVLACWLLEGRHPSELPPPHGGARMAAFYASLRDPEWPRGLRSSWAPLLADCLRPDPARRLASGQAVLARLRASHETAPGREAPTVAHLPAPPPTGEPPELAATVAHAPSLSPFATQGAGGVTAVSSSGVPAAATPPLGSAASPDGGVGPGQAMAPLATGAPPTSGQKPPSGATLPAPLSVPDSGWGASSRGPPGGVLLVPRGPTSQRRPALGGWVLGAAVLGAVAFPVGFAAVAVLASRWSAEPPAPAAATGQSAPPAPTLADVPPSTAVPPPKEPPPRPAPSSPGASWPKGCGNPEDDPCSCCPSGHDCGGNCSAGLPDDALLALRPAGGGDGRHLHELAPGGRQCLRSLASGRRVCVAAEALRPGSLVEQRLEVTARELRATGVEVSLEDAAGVVVASRQVRQAYTRGVLCRGAVAKEQGSPLVLSFFVDDAAEPPPPLCAPGSLR